MRYNKSFNSVLDMTNWQNGQLSNRTVNHEDAQTRNHSFNLNYEIKTDSIGSKLTSNVSYLWFNRDKVSFNESFPLNNDKNNKYSALHQSVPQIINNYAANIDYLKKRQKGQHGSWESVIITPIPITIPDRMYYRTGFCTGFQTDESFHLQGKYFRDLFELRKKII